MHGAGGDGGAAFGFAAALGLARLSIPGEGCVGRGPRRRGGRFATGTSTLKRPRAVRRGANGYNNNNNSNHNRIRMGADDSDSGSIGYVPSEDDRPSGMSEVPTELTLSQQLLMKQYEDQVERMSKAECQDLALEIARQMMVKDNILRTMLKRDFSTGIDTPEPDDFLGEDKGSGAAK